MFRNIIMFITWCRDYVWFLVSSFYLVFSVYNEMIYFRNQKKKKFHGFLWREGCARAMVEHWANGRLGERVCLGRHRPVLGASCVLRTWLQPPTSCPGEGQGTARMVWAVCAGCIRGSSSSSEQQELGVKEPAARLSQCTIQTQRNGCLGLSRVMESEITA